MQKLFALVLSPVLHAKVFLRTTITKTVQTTAWALAAFLFLLPKAHAQDKHFTQFYSSPLTLNPALSGAMEGTYRVGAIYRDQWRKVLDNPIKTFSMAADLRFEANRRKGTADAIGLGIMFFNDKVSVVDFSTTQIAVSLAYHKALGMDEDQFLSIGVQGGLTQRNVNYGSLNFHDEFNLTSGYTGTSSELLPANNFAFPDLNVGINYTAQIAEAGSFFAGASIHHVLKPKISFYDDLPPIGILEGGRLYPKMNVQLSASIPFDRSNRVSMQPRILAAMQGPHMEINAGTNFRLAMGQYGGSALHFGTWARPVRNDGGFGFDAVVALFGLEIKSMLFGLSYDLNLKALQANQRQGAFELSISYLGNYDNEKVLCPKF
ncbi:MAG: PorP/SprF family type IX secretion system membrane protein [Saprospiraceae bacterium]|nr:PorP/SprF family type IX secretion system membrane protein [Saprospiraceae bacterium]